MDPRFTIDVLRADIAEQLYLEPEELSETENLFDEGLDSVRLLTLVERWREFGVETTFADLAEQPTLLAWWELLSEQAPDA
ncbi:phosphopantetheine-binding protein [Actinokineospora sp. PR83]|uniref:phosphopantetheine-binding protein n=1 Tax=Actinokineospora sp. PR83 TaxID=2884908 RepID=UPI0027E147E3|nr:phosphopantetheine-binding protein [Actinokineospora sp. PR83]MCG8914476.1 phosphopantetheine-binding protein [Actinokineospora sp. PR83]